MELDAHRRDAKFDTAPAPETLAGLELGQRVGLDHTDAPVHHICLGIAQQFSRLGVVLLVVPAINRSLNRRELDDRAVCDRVSLERRLDRREDARLAAVFRLRIGQ